MFCAVGFFSSKILILRYWWCWRWCRWLVHCTIVLEQLFFGCQENSQVQNQVMINRVGERNLIGSPGHGEGSRTDWSKFELGSHCELGNAEAGLLLIAFVVGVVATGLWEDEQQLGGVLVVVG